jgi:hypothetical protein
MDDEDPRIDELDREIAALRARVDELEALANKAADLFDAHFLPQTAAMIRTQLTGDT